MAGSGRPTAFTLHVGSYGAEALHVGAFSGTEGLSRLFDFRVDFHPRDGEPLQAADMVGRDALLTVEVRDAEPRYVHGYVRALEALGERGGRRRYRAYVAPTLWRLTQANGCRIFQNKSVPDILKQVLEAAGVEFRLALSGSCAPREYCVQYRESDFTFLSRLMEWEGLSYYFEHTDEAHTLVVVDAPSAYPPLPGGAVLPVRPDDGRAYSGEFLSRLELVHRLRPGAVHVKDFDFEKPVLDVSGKKTDPKGLAALELYDYPAGHASPGAGKNTARVRMEAAGMGGRTLVGQSISPRLVPGHVLEVDTPEDGTFAGEYLLTEVTHSGTHPETNTGSESLLGLYRNHFQLLPQGTPFRPRQLTPVPVIPGLQTATVVGPDGEELHTDAHGRVKVQFHWDREGKQDDKSSCWVRVGQPWGGVGWGHVWLPRIGQEVLVRFLEGDPDRPLIAGAVYNGTNATPYALPDEKTKSTNKSASSPGSGGFNEVRIEDAAGEEEVFTHAQKDEDLVTENDKDQQVFGFEDLLVKKDRKRTVEGNQKLDVQRDDVAAIEGNQTLTVQGNRSTRTAASHDEAVEGNQTMTVARGQKHFVAQGALESVGAAKATTIGAAYAVTVGLAYNEATGGLRSTEVGGLHTEFVLGSKQLTVSKDTLLKAGGDSQTEVAKGMTLTVGKDLTEQVGRDSHLEIKDGLAWLAKTFDVKADTLSIIVGGKVYLRVEKSGKVQFFGKTITLEGTDLKAKGAKVQLLAAGSVSSGSVDKVKIDALPQPKKAMASVEIAVKTPGGQPLANQAFEITLKDGTVKKGTLDGNGCAKVEEMLPGSYDISFPGLEGFLTEG
ncbi:type VI secretion system Vgr family protein [Pyxidicoccus xibeiensis]|uniref:type VI secretion system Vgr family protein n=1 Tax=Pyxidicoccus xibeiensis TaxID=2906759 RepID=UPI0020A8103F|nr:type VI secretion system tip protein VgrG [Pyxidicoccus xibeiensis]MCP3145262.1 type VI secretion system tip protein VgrG [Pyxidicoccus xibeiensis]